MTAGFQVGYSRCSGKMNAWAALKLARSWNQSFTAHGGAHAPLLHSKAPQPNASNHAEMRNWREDLRALYCRNLARSISDALFSSTVPAPFGYGAISKCCSAATPATVLPSSWLELGLQRAPNVARLRAAFVERIARTRVLDEERRKAGQPIILDKAA